MNAALANVPKLKFERTNENFSDLKPVLRSIWQGGTIIKVDIQTGELATEETPDEFIQEIPLPNYHTILYSVNPRNPRGPVPENKDKAYER